MSVLKGVIPKEDALLLGGYPAKIFEAVDTAPTIDVPDRKVGKWIDDPVYKQTWDGKTWDGYTYCSECREMHKYGYRSNYCLNCGTKMEMIEDGA